MLSRFGYQVTGVATARELATAEANQFDLAVVDIGLPDSDGCELMTELRTKHGLNGLALTGYGMPDDIERCRQAGFSKHLLKPFQMDELLTAVRELTGSAAHPPTEEYTSQTDPLL